MNALNGMAAVCLWAEPSLAGQHAVVIRMRPCGHGAFDDVHVCVRM